MQRYIGFVFVIVLVGATAVAADRLNDGMTLRLQLAGISLQDFEGGYPRDPATVEGRLGLGVVLQLELRRRALGIEIEASGLEVDIHTSVALYGGTHGTYERDQRIAFRRVGVGFNHYVADGGKTSLFIGLRGYAQLSDEYDYGYDFGSWCVAPHLGLDLHSGDGSRWFFTADLQLNVLNVEEAGTKLMPQLSLGAGVRL